MSSVIAWILLAAVALMAVCAFVFSLIVYKRMQNTEKRYDALVNVLRHEIAVMNTGAVGMGRRLKHIEAKLDITAEKQQELENRDPGALAYNQAAKLMEMGAGVDDLISSCGIARPEAELMALLHREIRANPALDSH